MSALYSVEQIDAREASAQAESSRLEEEDFQQQKKHRWLGRCSHGFIHYCGQCLEADLRKCHANGKASGHLRERRDCGYHLHFCVESIRYLVPIGGHFEVVSFDEAERKRKYIDWDKVTVLGVPDEFSLNGFMFHPFDLRQLHELIFSHMTPKTVEDFQAYVVRHYEEWASVPARARRALTEACVEGYPFSDLEEHREMVVHRRVGNAKAARDYRERKRERGLGKSVKF